MENNSVLIITEVFYPEEFLINDIARRWVAEGKKVSVLTRNPAYPYGKIFKGYKNSFYTRHEENGITVYRYHIIENYRDSKFRKISNYIWNATLASGLSVTFFRQFQNIFIYHTGPLTVALPGVLLKKINKSKVVIWTQDIWPDVAFAYGLRKNKFTVWLIERFVNFIYKNCDIVIATSRPVQNDISRRIGKAPYFIPNWPMDVFKLKSSNIAIPNPKQFVFTFAGNIGAMQNLDKILRAFHQWSGNRDDVRLDIYGDGSALPDLKTIIREEAITNIHLNGRVPVEQIPGIYEASDVLLISLRSDAVLEKYVPAKFSTYLMAGKPILGVISGAVEDYIQEYSLGYVVHPDNTTEMAKGFDFFIRMPDEEKDQIRIRASALYEKEFDAKRNYELLTELVFNPPSFSTP